MEPNAANALQTLKIKYGDKPVMHSEQKDYEEPMDDSENKSKDDEQVNTGKSRVSMYANILYSGPWFTHLVCITSTQAIVRHKTQNVFPTETMPKTFSPRLESLFSSLH
ncbi:hypothetical protein BCR33DRAFT_166625 [Rhizoclosmatium globosum]|uniref:Uncharacterized protein n=1 Tax=Rhizoclosmatium globosum TaxID=329046 RepID=A0A1Y2AHK0_9FUNG|nr:hypothetical protein BCR33DRAFT_166625 [Rhizoclosmatium globosum]|eukprot:ORY22059.1 hypothetical protein BCR33DRAFT_166625 [Rhizoclosmatium globosum]